jgi:ABC-type phosphate transport system substrate-binding protein
MALTYLPKLPFLPIKIASVFTAVLATAPLAHADSIAQRAGSNAASIRIGGSSTVFPIMMEAIRAFRAAGNSTKIDLKETGTSEGFRRFCNGQLEIANASRPINSKELKACSRNRINFIELPIAFDALTVVVHPANTWAKQISTKELARLWGQQAEAKIDRWPEVNLDWHQLLQSQSRQIESSWNCNFIRHCDAISCQCAGRSLSAAFSATLYLH